MTNLMLRGFLAFEVEKVLADIAEAIGTELGEDVLGEVNIDEGCGSKSYPLARPASKNYIFTNRDQRTPYIIVQGDDSAEMMLVATAINTVGYDVQVDRPLLAFMAKPS